MVGLFLVAGGRILLVLFVAIFIVLRRRLWRSAWLVLVRLFVFTGRGRCLLVGSLLVFLIFAGFILCLGLVVTFLRLLLFVLARLIFLILLFLFVLFLLILLGLLLLIFLVLVLFGIILLVVLFLSCGGGRWATEKAAVRASFSVPRSSVSQTRGSLSPPCCPA